MAPTLPKNAHPHVSLGVRTHSFLLADLLIPLSTLAKGTDLIIGRITEPMAVGSKHGNGLLSRLMMTGPGKLLQDSYKNPSPNQPVVLQIDS